MMLKNKTLFRLIAGVLITLFSLAAQASDTFKQDFTVRIYEESCSLNVNGSGSNQGTVAMALSSTSDYTGLWSGGADTDFYIQIKGCDPSLNAYKLNFFNGWYHGSAYPDPGLSMPVCRTALPQCYLVLQSTNPGIGIAFFYVSSDSEVAKCNDAQKVGWMEADNEGTSCPQTIDDAAMLHYRVKAVQVTDDKPQPGPYQATVMFTVHYM
ncbi:MULTISPECIES: type 1 fimbrial protein [Citrobacter]|uniref:fimbrial protein n=1 Tax=Citrobacter TaxID=544 RepID=UPI0016608112|nr:MULTISPECIES: type 1 fimbrial protein [Citrobacter]MBA4714507.1 type 1 fimbrial protein [Citrobacter pasteurii]MBD0803583.1 type 1 fimbrial protein [Citrobacter sp. C6_1]MBD0812150.1 type 1 fimbrial protein [Citrobacter sp. C6_2]